MRDAVLVSGLISGGDLFYTETHDFVGMLREGAMQKTNAGLETTTMANPEQLSPAAQRAERAFGLSLAFSGVRCILQYVIFPFVLPLIGIAGEFSVYISIVINLVAMLALIYSARRFWIIDYKYKRQYLFVAVAAFVILCVFLALDIQHVAQLAA